MQTNCPNCGAPIISSVCEYCGTRHVSKSEIDILNAKTKALKDDYVLGQRYKDLINTMKRYHRGIDGRYLND